jgi:hypothetical protein
MAQQRFSSRIPGQRDYPAQVTRRPIGSCRLLGSAKSCLELDNHFPESAGFNERVCGGNIRRRESLLV